MTSIRKTLLSAIIALMTVCSLLFGITLINSSVTARADEELTATDFAVAIAVRIKDDEHPNGGIRFKVRIEKAKFETLMTTDGVLKEGVKTGVLVTSNAIAKTLEGGLVKANAEVAGVYDLDTTDYWKAITENEVDYYESVVAIYNVPTDKSNVKLAVMPYVVNGGTTVYRNEAGVASMADAVLADTENGADFAETYIHNYTITYYDKDGNEIDGGSEEKQYGDTIAEAKVTAPEITGYTFAAWKNAAGTAAWTFGENGTKVTGDTNLYAKYSATEYTATINRANGSTEYVTFTIEDRAAKLESISLTANDAEWTYSWSSALPAELALQNYTFTETREKNTYTITWNNDNGDTLDTDEVAYGEVPAYTGETPTKTATAQYTYTFDAWTPALTAVTGDATYTATFTENTRNYTVEFDTNGGTSIADGEVSYGDTAVKPTDPVKAGNTFNGWKLGAEDYNFTAPVTEDITLTADYTPYYYDADFSSATHEEPAEGLKIKVDGLGGAVPDLETALYDDNGTSVIKVVTAVDRVASGVKVTLGDGLAVADYACIKFRVKTTDYVSVDVNDKNCAYASYANYTDVDLISLAKAKGIDTVYSFSVYRTLVDNITIYVDKVIIVGWGSDINYDFSSESDADIYAVSATGGATLNGIVSDANATDGYAVKATTVAASASGLLINFNNVTLADWDGIVLRFRTTNSVGVQVYSEKNGAWINAANWGNYPSYTKVNLKGVLEANGDTTLTQFRITRDSVNGIGIYVDYVMFYDEMPSPYNMTSLFDDKPSVSGGTTSIVADAGVDDGYALQISVSGGTWKHGYLTLSTPFTLNNYAAIKIRLKKSGGYVYVVNGSNTNISASYSIPDATFSDYVDFYIFPTADCAKIDFSTGGVSSITVVIDDITLIPVSQLDSFYTYSADTVKTSPNATIVADENATDGYALKIVRNSGNNAYYYLGRSYTFADYDHVYVRCRCDSGIGVYLRAGTKLNSSDGSGITISSSMTTTYTTIDLVAINNAAATPISTFNQIDIWNNASAAVYIDSITFVKKAA